MILRGLIIFVCVVAGIFLASNVDKGVERFAPDQLHVQLRGTDEYERVLAKLPEVHILDRETGLVQIPYGQTTAYIERLREHPEVGMAFLVPVEPTFSLKRYGSELSKQLNQYREGNYGELYYNRAPRAYPINSYLENMISRSLSYLIPALIFSVTAGLLLAIWGSLQPRIGRLLDGGQALLMALPDFFIVVLLQILAIFLAKAAGRTVIKIMQVGDDVPFVIPFLAIVILPTALIYGAMRIAFDREWQESYIMTAKSKGLTRTQIFFRHILRNTLEDFLVILPKSVALAVTSLVIAEVMTGVFGLGGYAVNERITYVTSLPITCVLLAAFVMATHLIVAVLRNTLIVQTKEGA
ncbi:ABC transporter permease subunit [Tumebacillus sp. DT12]|uniref:ABC transporter permease subunit n=1 Tax=Tumebacillus lacus TaxID=2995335 RepID=A0ABT3X1I3_9BACL|nr:ABC transporter permease subunit [Tumebacillus lacus]MCX7569632.1 ABC transporter permease subunit [Tumebacillus lacus]